MQETQVQFLGQEDPLEKEMAIHSSILAWKIPWTEAPGHYSLWGHKESEMTEWLSTHQGVFLEIFSQGFMAALSRTTWYS